VFKTLTKHRLRPVALAAASVLAGQFPTLAAAQSAATPAAAPASAPASDTPAVQDVVITAQKRTERLVDTPVAAAVISGEALQKSNASELTDLNLVIPSLELKGSFNGRVPMAMRGISTNANEAAVGLTSGVSIMIDGVPVPSDSMAANELADLRAVEVLKGPQSTLGGRTASAGVINFITQAPSTHWMGNAGLTFTNDGEKRANGFVSGPLADSLAISLSGYGNERFYPIRNTLLGEDSRTISDGLRAKLLFTPVKDLDILLTGRASHSESRGGTFTYQYLTPGAALFPLFPWNTAGIPQSQALPGIAVRYGNTDYASPVHMDSKIDDRDVSLNIEKRASGYTFTSTTARQSETAHNVQDVTQTAVYFLDILRLPVIPLPPTPGVPPLFDNTQHVALHPTAVSQEFKVASPLDAPVSYVAGLFWSDTKVIQDYVRAMFVNPRDDTTTSDNKTLGLYGRATWNFNPSTSLLTGLRLNQDRISYAIVDRAGGFASAASDTSTATVGDLTLRQKLGKDNMAYFTVARGYKPRAFNTAQTLSSDDPIAPVNKENIQHIELGSKMILLGGRLSVNTALFNTDYKNYQVQVYDTTSVVEKLKLSNAGAARTSGLELDASLAATGATHLTASAAWIDARFISYKTAPCYPGQTEAQGCTPSDTGPVQDVSGKTMPDSPKFKLTLGADHFIDQHLVPWDLRVNGQYAWRTHANFQADQNPYTVQRSFGVLNLGASATSPDGRYMVSLFVNNVTNRFYNANEEDFFSGLWGATTNAVIGEPARDARRYGGVRFNVYFD